MQEAAMIKIILSELDFDYELQALVNSFFSGQRSSVEVGQELTASSMKEILSEKKEKLVIGICFRMEKITIGLYCNEYFVQKEVAISGNEDWHKHEDTLEITIRKQRIQFKEKTRNFPHLSGSGNRKRFI